MDTPLPDHSNDQNPNTDPKPGIRVLICGGRNWNHRQMTFRKLDALHRIYNFATVIHGAASGADSLGGAWAKARGIPVNEYPANWRPRRPDGTRDPSFGSYDRAAGFKRNQQMIDEGHPDLVIAFPGTNGTADMIKRSQKAAITVVNLHNIVDSWLRLTGMSPQ